MKLLHLFFIFLFAAFNANAANSSDATDEEHNPLADLEWQVGPLTSDIAAKASLKLADDSFAFLDEANSRKFLELTGNIPESGNFTLLSVKDDWFALFTFDPSGYVKDDEKVDPDALLKQLKSGDKAANEERKRLNIPQMYTEGWYVPPHYDPETKQLEWGLKARGEDGHEISNYTIRILGRTGVMSATLVSNPETLDTDVKTFKTALKGFDFNPGEKYSEFKEGDRLAEYGLAALVAGGLAVAASKKGVWAAIASFAAAAWKFIAIGFVGLLAWIRSRFSKKN